MLDSPLIEQRLQMLGGPRTGAPSAAAGTPVRCCGRYECCCPCVVFFASAVPRQFLCVPRPSAAFYVPFAPPIASQCI
jgi:hypothetical protein